MAILGERVGQYVFISTGQVYLVRTGLDAPFMEDDYSGEVMPEPDRGSGDYDGWMYGFRNGDAEDRLFAAWQQRRLSGDHAPAADGAFRARLLRPGPQSAWPG